MKVAAFLSHPIQHLTPLWQALSRMPDVTLKVFYYSKFGVEASFDRDFGVKMAWDVDLLAGHDHEFLPRRWPTKDPQDSSSTGLNGNIKDTLRQGWDVAYVAGYSHINNWVVARICRKLRIPLLCQSDTNVLNAFDKGRCKLLVKRLIVPRFLNMVSGYLAPGDNGRAYFLHYCNRPDRVFFCPIPVDTDRFVRTVAEAKEQQLAELRTKYGIPTDKKIVVFCAKFVPWKRPLDLVEAVKHLNRDDVVALFIGDGRLRSAIEDAGKDKVIVTGFVNQAVFRRDSGRSTRPDLAGGGADELQERETEEEKLVQKSPQRQSASHHHNRESSDVKNLDFCCVRAGSADNWHAASRRT